MASQELASFQERWAEFSRLERLVNHWWWRPGWRQGRSFYTWHITFDNQSSKPLHDLVAHLHDRLDGIAALDPIPQRWLHLTMQGLGFTDEVADTDVHAIVQEATGRLSHVPAFDMTLGPIEGDDEATGLLVRPWAAVHAVRDTIRDAIGTVWNTIPETPEFRPHVSIAYSNTDAPTPPLRERLTELRNLEPVTIPIHSVQLIRLNRDNQMYQWNTITDIALGS
ncbi:2'-5' RNA ligase family protein [Myceligenerans pegani]|uniref:2'-5' RNA ligase family protein n=1 Tax=Myceligenerans pegani TaxID=2776917 RepID=A0ABR9N6F2_9MICO|nr:2'-5' RNA ligase family protein [Myceligenerans sp. TRM 65318]MBE1878766.1 2'-5' RNA ligase family protein [Myceligenerans sp. TRM 65318]MBE3021037.1 2'-5' RNA ligase family protein [Myceligenerans sp. TRM 65318]